MNAERKALAELTADDFGRSRIWRLEQPKQEFATPVDPSEDFMSDARYVALTDYVLRGGMAMLGYCLIPDCAAHVFFDGAGRCIPLWVQSRCTQDEAASLARALGRSIEQVFPIGYQVTVTIQGKYLEGEIAAP